MHRYIAKSLIGWPAYSVDVQVSAKGTLLGKKDTAETLCEIIRDKRVFIKANHAATHPAFNSP